jgi:dipeptide transport system permease protein
MTSPLAEAWRRNPVGGGAAVVLLVIFVLALLAPLIAPYDPDASSLDRRLLPGFWAEGSSAAHLLGTDSLGRDLLSRLLHGARASLVMTLAPVAIAVAVGVPIGLLPITFKRFDAAGMRLMDVVFAFPPLLLALAIVAVLGPGAINAILAIAITDIPRVARMARGQVLVVREQEYLTAAITSGAGTIRLVSTHVIPNIIAVIIVYSSLLAGRALLTVAGLGFLGLGIRPPTAEWGSMLSNARQLMLIGTWEPVALPGAAILITVLAFNLMGDALRDMLDPRLRS